MEQILWRPDMDVEYIIAQHRVYYLGPSSPKSIDPPLKPSNLDQVNT